MKWQLWKKQARSRKILPFPTPKQTKEIFYKEFFHEVRGNLKARRLKDTTDFIVIATPDSFDHIFFKNNTFQVARAERVFWIRDTIKNSQHIFEDKKKKQRFHYLQSYNVNEKIESFCVITKVANSVSRIITAFPIKWSRVYAFLQQK